MEKMKREKRIWVDTVFHSKLKKRAKEEDISILDLTSEMARDNDPFNMFKKKRKKERFYFKF